MKFNPIPLITLSTLLSLFTQAQNNPGYELMLKSGSFVPQRNITTEYLLRFNKDVARTGEKSFAILQFENIPSVDQRNQLKQAGIELLEYIPNNAYTVIISKNLPIDVLQRAKARALIELSADQKMQPQLSKGIFPASAVKVPGTLDVWVSFPRSISVEKVIAGLQQKNFDILSDLYKEYRVISLRIAAMRLQELASLPFIDYVQAAKPEDRIINHRS
ncbi:MAG TPA: hypothetical protein VFO70_04275, partial [Chitinophagaceae bacterium]|nr:hypothetical protein [Chitinophagaceae bacterium]